jgi:hypothetical protein
VAEDGRREGFAEALGSGADTVARLLDAVTTPDPSLDTAALAELAAATPAGLVSLPLAVVDLAAGVEAAGAVEPTWLAEVDRRRTQARDCLAADGRGDDLEAALHVALLVMSERFDPEDDDTDAHVASGARLWLLAGAVASALGGKRPDPFAPWAELVAAGWWPIGPSAGRLVVAPGDGRAAAGPR